jgi:RNA-directed DNA polymerase
VDEAKPFDIAKREVWEAFKKVKANQGAAGVDGQSIADFEADLSNNLYKLWNRLSSGSYFPPPVRRVDIPKANGGTRPLGIPTVADRIAQEVVRRYLEPSLEPVFHADSYGYRPGRSAIDAVRRARQRCWRYKSNALRSLAAMSWQRPNIGSRMNREVHVRFWERPGVKLLRATRHDRQNSQ